MFGLMRQLELVSSEEKCILTERISNTVGAIMLKSNINKSAVHACQFEVSIELSDWTKIEKQDGEWIAVDLLEK